MNRLLLFAPLLLLALVACNDEGPTAIELPIGSLEFTTRCGPIVVETQCRPGVLARTPEGQAIASPVLRWSSNNSSVASVNDDGVIVAVSAGDAVITVANTTATVTAQQSILVLPLSVGRGN